MAAALLLPACGVTPGFLGTRTAYDCMQLLHMNSFSLLLKCWQPYTCSWTLLAAICCILGLHASCLRLTNLLSALLPAAGVSNAHSSRSNRSVLIKSREQFANSHICCCELTICTLQVCNSQDPGSAISRRGKHQCRGLAEQHTVQALHCPRQAHPVVLVSTEKPWSTPAASYSGIRDLHPRAANRYVRATAHAASAT